MGRGAHVVTTCARDPWTPSGLTGGWARQEVVGDQRLHVSTRVREAPGAQGHMGPRDLWVRTWGFRPRGQSHQAISGAPGGSIGASAHARARPHPSSYRQGPSMSAAFVRLFLVRHAEALANPDLRYLAIRDAPLTDRGQWQPRQLAQAF